jgi:hypothetical protein
VFFSVSLAEVESGPDLFFASAVILALVWVSSFGKG